MHLRKRIQVSARFKDPVEDDMRVRPSQPTGFDAGVTQEKHG